MDIVIYHNPACSKSRQTLALMQEAGCEPEIVEYLKAGWTRPQLDDLLDRAGLTPREVLRTAGSLARELGLMEEGATEDQILDAMIEHPKLVERPIVDSPLGVRVCRPPERVLDLIGKADA
ncbi:arsenate reductase (glutaredoxin) [Rhodobacteraceae bacterium NNCM2]|nr:arsenate reductase (glutaredoxin) [Coraliihabitans acroporae]